MSVLGHDTVMGIKFTLLIFIAKHETESKQQQFADIRQQVALNMDAWEKEDQTALQVQRLERVVGYNARRPSSDTHCPSP